MNSHEPKTPRMNETELVDEADLEAVVTYVAY